MNDADLRAQVQGHLQFIVATAKAAPAGGGADWDALLARYGLAPMTPTERHQSVAALGMTRGAVPSEVLVALRALAAWARAQPSGVAMSAELDALPEGELARYEAAVVPPRPAPAAAPAPAAPAAPGLASIFANAESTSKEVPWANMKYERAGVLTCVHCGGPQEAPMDFMCRFCRRPMAGGAGER